MKLSTSRGLICSFAAMVFAPGLSAQGVLTWHNDVARSGQNLQETLLSPSNVNSASFGLLHTLTLDGPVDAQPLYVPGLVFNGTPHNVLFVATENDTLYAFDADNGGTPLWTYSALRSGETASDSDSGCGQVGSKVGITSTPVIDLTQGTNGTIYFVAMTKDSSAVYHDRLHAVDLIAGTEQSSWPIEIAATYSALTFVPSQYKERAALVIANGAVYTSWASNCDRGSYNGWIIGYNEATQAQSVLNLTPHGTDGAIWMAGAGPAADAGGNLYFLMANGTFDTTLNANGFPSNGDYGNAFMNLSTASGLSVVDYFTMDNTTTESGIDEDLGSGGAMLLPTLNDALGNPRELAVGAGKDGNAYVVDRNNMGKYNGTKNAVYQEFELAPAFNGNPPDGVFSSPAWFNNTLYYGPVGQQLSAYAYSGGSFGAASFQSNVSSGFGFPGVTPSISANGSTDGIVWAVKTGSPAVLYAFNAANLAELYDSTQAASSRDNFGTGITFTTPTVTGGKVYVGTTTGVAIFGLLNCSYSLDATAPNPSTIAVAVTTSPGCSWSATSASDFITITGSSSGTGSGTVDFTVTAYAGTSRAGLIFVAGHVLSIVQTGQSSLGLPSGPSPANGSEGVSVNPTLTWTASSGATSYDVYFGTSPNPPLVTNTTSTSYMPGTLNPGITYYWMVVAKNSSGTNGSTVWSFITGIAQASVVSVTPSSGSGISQTFSLQYSDAAGAASLQLVYAWFNTQTASASSCMLYYNAGTNQINLLNDAATAWTAATPGAATTLQNSQCSLNVAAVTVTPSGNTLTLSLPMTFKVTYAGAKQTFLDAKDVSGANSGWKQLGTWTVPGTIGTPAAVSVTPSSGSGLSQTFALHYSDTAGAASLQLMYAWFNTQDISTNSCMLYYNAATNQINLLNDAATAWMVATAGASTTLQNSQCSLNVAAVTVTPSGNTLTLSLPMTFTEAYAGAKQTLVYAKDISGSDTGWQQLGTWTITGTTGIPAAVSVTPSSGSGMSQTFALHYSDTSGAASLQLLYAWFNTQDASASSCMLYYNAATNQINLLNDAATAWTAATVGAATTLQNSQCSLNVAAVTVTPSGNTLTLSLPMTFAAAFVGAKQTLMDAKDVAGSNSGWQQLGTWIVPGTIDTTGTPAVVSAMPSSGSGMSQTFALEYSDTAGAASLQLVYAWFNTQDASASSCMLYYNAATNQINLLNDAATAWTAATRGAATTLQNSQCSVNVAAVTVTPSGNTLTLSLPMTFTAAYAGAKQTFLDAKDILGSNTGWQQLGTWTIPGTTGTPGTPAAVSVTPSTGSGTSQTFSLHYSDTAGAGSLQLVYAWFNTQDASASSCMLYYNAATNQISLLNDAATAWTAATLGAVTTLQNSQCSVNAADVTVTPSGNTLTLSLPMTFTEAYAGAKQTFLDAKDVSGANSGWQELGTWTIQ